MPGHLQTMQILQNLILGHCNVCNGVKTRFWTIAMPAMA